MNVESTHRSTRHPPGEAGFTIVELVAVILIASILGMVAFARFISPSAFNEQGTQDALLTSIRQAQQAALGRSDVTFEIGAGAGEYQFVVKTASQELNRTTVSSQGVVLQTGTAAALAVTTDSCASGTRFDESVSGFVIAFDSRGNIATFDYAANPEAGLQSTTDPLFDFNGVRICVNDSVAASVCVSPAGYAYEGNCER